MQHQKYVETETKLPKNKKKKPHHGTGLNFD